MLLSIIIVNYNTANHIKMCIESLNTFLLVDDYEIIVADNNSPDRDIENLATAFPKVKFIFRNINDGFGGGCNSAVKLATGKYLLFLNPDVKVLDNSITELLDFIEKNEDAGVVSGLLVNSESSVIYCFNDFINLRWELLQLFGIGYEREINKLVNRTEIKDNKPFEVDWFHGAFLMMRRKDFDDVKGFDEKYFMYYEDTDLCYNIKNKLNKKNICLPSVRVYHHTKSSLKGEKIDNIYTFHMNRSKILFADQYYPFKKYIVKTIGFLSVLIRIFFLPFQKKYSGMKKVKLRQLTYVLKLYISKTYLESSKFKFVNI